MDQATPSTASANILHCALELSKNPGYWRSSFRIESSRAFTQSQAGTQKS